MLGKIFIKDLLVRCQIGINEEEKKEMQDILINVELAADVIEAIADDDLNKTVDYRPVYRYILELAGTSRFGLIETLASAIGDYSLAFNPRVRYVMVRVEKPNRFNFLKSVGIEISRTRK
ncbi:MAG: dihydroneopterin aldolase [Candidatus Magasanikbacteria bacterium]|nr:dihydroneopterin aldolase [Candidatus Magasanikbacteria bacterium]